VTLAAPADGTLAAIAAYGLAGSRRSLPGAPLDPAAWDALVTLCAARHLVGLLDAAVAAGEVVVPDERRDAFADLAGGVADRSRAAARAAVAGSAALAAAGIDHRVLDGPAVVHRVFRDPARRPVEAVDVLVAPSDLDAAGALTGVPVRVCPEALPPGLGARVRLADLSEAPVDVQVDGGRLPGVALDAALVRSCARAASGGADQVVALRDVAQIALSGTVDGDLVRSRAAGWRSTAVVAWAVARAWQAFDLADKTELSVWAGRYEPEPAERRALRGPAKSGGRHHGVAGVAHRWARAMRREHR
jgi:hypothetical protein